MRTQPLDRKERARILFAKHQAAQAIRRDRDRRVRQDQIENEARACGLWTLFFALQRGQSIEDME